MSLITPYFQLPTELEMLDYVPSRSTKDEKVSHFQLPTEEELRGYVGSLSHGSRLSLEFAVAHLAGEKAEWGERHFYDDLGRLTQAIINMKLPFWRRTALVEGHAQLIASQYPLISDQEWKQRVECVAKWELLKRGLFEKHPGLASDFRERAFKAQELFFLTFPAPLDLGPMQSMIRVLEALKFTDSMTAQIVFDRLMTRESFRPTQTDIGQAIALKALERAAREKIYEGSLQRSTQATFSDVFYIHFPEGEGKFKPLSASQAIKEAYGAELDRELGFGMTVPTRFFRTGNFWQELEEIRTLFLSNPEDENEVLRLKKRGIGKLQSPRIPVGVRNAIFGEMYRLCGKGRQIDALGEKLFYDRDGHQTTLTEKARAIQRYFDSDVFREHMNLFKKEGSIQTWIRDCGRAYDLITKDPDGGNKLRTAPKTLVHLYVLLGILKGSMDCSSGNTFIHYEKGRVVNFWDFDDERSCPEQNNWWSFRLWQLGLPQSAEPFDRATLLLFIDKTFLKRFKRHTGYEAQLDRFVRMVKLFEEELDKETIVLTPRDLFFQLFGGREHYDYVKKQFNDEGVRISPIELFEFHLSEIGRGWSYTSDENEKSIVGNNMKSLYHPNPL